MKADVGSLNLSQESSSSDRWKACLTGLGWLLFVVAMVALPLGYVGFVRHGSWGLVAAVTAGFICFTSAGVAYSVTVYSSGTPNALPGLLLGVFLRTVVPFLVSVLLAEAHAPLAEGGLLGMLLITYLVVLAVETGLVVRVVQSRPALVR